MPQYNGVWTLEQQAQALTNQQWVTDPNFRNTTLLLQADSTTTSSQNSSFLDSSSNNFPITRNGNTSQGSFSPFSQAPGYWSNYTASGYLTVSANAGFALSGDFTIECWVFSGDASIDGTTRRRIFATGGGDIVNSLQLLLGTSAGNSSVISVLNNNWLIEGTINVVTNSWNHIAVTRSGTSLKLFVNGVQSGTTATTSQNFNSGTSNTGYIGASSTGSGLWQGYISNLRIIVGTAIYTAPFAVPNVPFATNTTNQQLLVCYNNNYNDANTATTAKTITANSTPSVQVFSPFLPSRQWTSDVIGGSGYYDGSGDYLSVASYTNLTLGTGDFTFECWIYPTNWSNSRATMARGGGATNSPIFAKYDASNNLGIANEGVAWIISDATLPPVNAWSHVAWTRSGNTFKIYVNGVQSGSTGTNSANFSAPILTVGASDGSTANGFFTGYMTNIRVVKGTAVYTSNFTPPTVPLTAITNTQLLLNNVNAGVYDGTMSTNLETVGNAQIAVSPVKYGSGSIYFDGSGDWLSIPSSGAAALPRNQGLALGSGNFTIEFWMYALNFTSTRVVVNLGYEGTTQRSYLVYVDTSNNLHFAYSTSGANNTDTTLGSTGILAASWVHIAVVRSTNTVTGYVNGVALPTTVNISTDTIYSSVGEFIIGSDKTNSFIGYIDDLRITKGVARYFTNFTPPKQALPRQ